MPARFGLGSAEFELVANNDALLKAFAESQAQARVASKRIADAIDQEMRRVEGAYNRTARNVSAATAKIDAANRKLTQSAGGLGGFGKSAFQFGAVAGGASALGAGGLIVAATSLNRALTGTIEVTQRAQQAQFALNVTYRQGAEIFNQFARQQADALKLSESGFKASAVTVGTLARNYAFTSDQLQVIIKRSADLAAVSGLELQDATKRVSDAIRGEAEAAEVLGLTLNSDAVKATANMTSEQRKNWETLNELTKSQVRYQEFLKQSAFAEGAAAKRAQDSAGAFDRLGASVEKLGLALGQTVLPVAQSSASAIADIADAIRRVIEAQEQLRTRGGVAAIGGRGVATSGRSVEEAVRAGLAGQAPGAHTRIGTGQRPFEFENEQSVADMEALAKRREAIEKESLGRRLEALKAFAKEAAEIERRRLQTAIGLAEQGRRSELTAAENAHRFEVERIEQARDAQLAAVEADIAGAERARDAAIAAAEARRDAVIAAIESEQRARDQAREQEDRALSDERAAFDRALGDTRQSEDRALSDRRQAEDRALDDRRAEIDRAFADEREAALDSLADQEEARRRTVRAEIELIEDRRDAAVRALEDEADAARDAAEDRIRAIDDEIAAEAERHAEAMDNLRDEEAARIAAIDRRIAKLDEEEQRLSRGEQRAPLENRVRTAQGALAAAQALGDPYRIRAAQQQLAAAQAEQRRLNQQFEREDLRERLEARKDAIREEFQARERAASRAQQERARELQAEKRQIAEALDTRLEAIADQKQAIQDETKAHLDELRDRDQAEQDAHAETLERVNAEFEHRERVRQAERQAEDRALADDRAAQDRALADARQAEDRALAESRLAQDRAIADQRAAEDEAFRQRVAAANAALEQERAGIEAHYNGPDGVIAKIRAAGEKIKAEADRQLAEALTRFEAEKAAINETYDVLVNGLTSRQQQIEDALKAQVKLWETWSKDTVAEIQKAIDKLQEFIDQIKGLSKIETVQVDAGTGGGGAPPGGDLAFGPVVRNATSDSYWTSGGTHGGHPAADIFAPKGSPIYAPVGGTLDNYGGREFSLGGNAAQLIGDDGRAYYFAHGDRPFASGRVERGNIIGAVGNSGNAQATASHLHFAISTKGPGLFNALNGSGDVMGGPEYWGEGGGGNWIEVTLFGKKLRVNIADASVGGEVGRWINSGLAAAGKPRDWAFPTAQIAAAESGVRLGDGTVKVGTGNPRAVNPQSVNGEHASGLMQTLPSTFRAHRVESLPDDVFHPVANVGAASRYIGRRWGSPTGTPYWRTGRFDTRGVAGYAEGGWITSPTLLSDYRTGEPFGLMGEAGPEAIVPADRLGGDTYQFNGYSCDHVIAKVQEIERRKRFAERLR